MQREPIFNVPAVALALIAAFVAVHGAREYVLTEAQDGWLMLNFAFVPARLTWLFDPSGVADAFSHFTGRDGRQLERAARFWLGDGSAVWWTPLSYAFLHSDWVH